MNLFKCRECGAEFEKTKSLHAHLKAHKMTIGKYYAKHFPRVDLYTHKPIVFKDINQYLSADFNRPSNLKRWIQREPASVVKPYLTSVIKEKLVDRTEYMMGQVQLKSYNLPDVKEIEEVFGSFDDFCEEAEYDPQFPDEMPIEWVDDHSGLTILVDTREQKPLQFRNTEKFTLDFGDYTLPARHFDYTFVDRKSVEDFISTMSSGFERVNEEIERCKSVGCYLFFVIDGTMDRVQDYMRIKGWNTKSNHAHIMHNMREILRKHAGHCQFVFTSGRKQSTEIVPKLLYCGQRVWNVDIQYYLDYGLDSR